MHRGFLSWKSAQWRHEVEADSESCVAVNLLNARFLKLKNNYKKIKYDYSFLPDKKI